MTGWILLFAIAAVSLVPADFRPEINLPNDLEHAAIFFSRRLRVWRRLPYRLSRLAFVPGGFYIGHRNRTALDTRASRCGLLLIFVIDAA